MIFPFYNREFGSSFSDFLVCVKIITGQKSSEWFKEKKKKFSFYYFLVIEFIALGKHS